MLTTKTQAKSKAQVSTKALVDAIEGQNITLIKELGAKHSTISSTLVEKAIDNNVGDILAPFIDDIELRVHASSA